MKRKAQISKWLKERGASLGFSMMGITQAQPSARLNAYLEWVKAGMHGTMGYMAREDRIERRQDLNVILPGAKSLVVVALDYLTISFPEDILSDPRRGRISNYSWRLDYHDVLLSKLKQLAAELIEKTGKTVQTKAYVDTGAILERSHAKEAGLGFVGKNTMLIHPQRGSFFFLGEIITDVTLDYDQSGNMPGCGTCTRCLSACPTNAFPTPYTLDARRCISYLTIEHKGFIDKKLRPLMGNWVYGCDICQNVCPWQRFSQAFPREAFSAATIDQAAPPLDVLLRLDDVTFADRFASSPIKRIKRERLVRNACIAAGNSQHKELADALLPLLHDHSPLVRGHAAWALSELQTGRLAIQAALPQETNVDVIGEFNDALERTSP